ncbi:MAG: DUF2793 domain-containing protein [Roseovarius sp.]
MSEVSARLDLPLIQPSQAQKHVTHNEALQLLDALVQAVVEETGAETPPLTPVTGTLYALGAAPGGEWAGEAGRLALRIPDAWLFITPREGWRVWDRAAGKYRVHRAGAWVEMVPELDNLDGLGIATSHDATNRLAVAAEASLFTHAGAGHQLKINKAAAGETASLLFQSNWTGHAEMGLAGDTAFSVKVSADGAAWSEALRADAAAQTLAIPFQVTGAAVQAGPSDTTPGRLMRADFGYGPGNLLGTVGQSGGVPTGAVIERGSGAEGSYVRFADGTQICTHLLSVPATDTAEGALFVSATDAIWTFPAAFAAPPAVAGSAAEAMPAAAFLAPPLAAPADPAAAYRCRGCATASDASARSYHLIAMGRWF